MPNIVGTQTSGRSGLIGSPYTISHTVPAGSNRALYVAVETDLFGGASPVSTVTYGGVALERFGVGSFGSCSVSWWVLPGPTVGTANLVIAAGVGNFTVLAINVDDVDPDWPAKGFTTATGTSTTPSVTIASATGDLVLDFVFSDGNTQVFTAGAGQTAAASQNSFADTSPKMASSAEAGGATVTMSWSLSVSDAWMTSGFSIPAAGTTVGPEQRISQVAVEAVVQPTYTVRASQVIVETVHQLSAAPIRLSQIVVEAIFLNTPPAAVSGATVAVGSTLSAPTVINSTPVTATTVANTSTLFAPTVALDTLEAATLSSGAVLFAPAVFPELTVLAFTIASGSSVFPPAVSFPPQSITGAFITLSIPGGVINAPVLVAVGTPTIGAWRILSSLVLYPPLVWTPGSIYLPRIESTSHIFAPIIPVPVGNSLWMGDGEGGLWID